MALFQRLLGPYSPQYGPILPKLSPEVVFQQIKLLLQKNLKDCVFMKKRQTQSLHFCSNFDHPLPSKDDRNRKKKSSGGEKLQPLDYPNTSKSKLYLRSPFPKKCDYYLQYLGYVCQETGQRHKSKGQNQNLTTFCKFAKNFGSNIFQFCNYRSQSTFEKNVYWIFKFGRFSWYCTYIFEKNEFDYLMQNLMLNRQAPISNFKNEKAKCSFALFILRPI